MEHIGIDVHKVESQSERDRGTAETGPTGTAALAAEAGHGTRKANTRRRYADLRTVYTAISRKSCAIRGSSAGESSARSASSQ